MEGTGPLAWAANNTAKMGITHPGHPGMQCWTLISTNAYGQRNKVPQEAVPPEVAAKVGDVLCARRGSLWWACSG